MMLFYLDDFCEIKYMLEVISMPEFVVSVDFYIWMRYLKTMNSENIEFVFVLSVYKFEILMFKKQLSVS